MTEESIAAAISWVKKLTFEQSVSEVSCLEALLEAGKDKTVSIHMVLSGALAPSLTFCIQCLYLSSQMIMVHFPAS